MLKPQNSRISSEGGSISPNPKGIGVQVEGSGWECWEAKTAESLLNNREFLGPKVLIAAVQS